MNVLGIIPARGGSKGIRHKNLRMVGGKPLLAYSIEAAKGAGRLDRVIVSTEDDGIAEAAKRFGAEVPFLRPAELAGDHISLIPVVQHALASLDRLGWRADIVVNLQPTCPLLLADDIDLAVNLIERTGCDSVVAVTEIQHHHPFRAMKVEGDRLLPLTEYTTERYLQKQDRPPAYGFVGGLYARRRELLERWSGADFALGADIRAVLVEPKRAVNIDHELDLLLFEALMAQRAGRALPAVYQPGQEGVEHD